MLEDRVLRSMILDFSNHKHPLYERAPLKASSLSRSRVNIPLRSCHSILFILTNLPRPHHPQTDRGSNVHPTCEEDGSGVASPVESDDLKANGFRNCAAH